MLRNLLIILLLPVAALLGWLALGAALPRADFVYAAEESRTLDPQRVSWLSEIQIASAMFEGLATLHPQTLQPEPAAAESWEISADGRTWTFHLRPEARWSDGTPLTAEDFCWSWLRVLDPRTKSQYAELLFVIAGARAYYESRANDDPADDWPAERVGLTVRDARTLRVTLAQPCPYFLELVAFITLAPVPRQVLEARPGGGPEREALWTRPGRIVVNGPFRLTEWRFKQSLRLERNPHYWGGANVALDSIEIYTTSSTHAALLAYETGRVDLVRGLGPALARRLREEQAAGRRPDFHLGDRFSTYFFRINCSRPPLDNPDLRKALSLAIDREALCAFVTGLGESPAWSFVPASAAEYLVARPAPGQDAAVHPAVRYRPPAGLGAGLSADERNALAREHLRRSGFATQGGARPLELMFASDNADYLRVAEALQAMWEQTLGLRIALRPIEGKVLSSRVRSLEYDLARADWFGDYLDPGTFLDMFITGSGQNRTGWSNAEYDRLIAAAAAEPDPARRFERFAAAEHILCVEEVPILPLFVRRGNFLLNPRFEGLWDNVREYLPLQRVRPRRAAHRIRRRPFAQAPRRVVPSGSSLSNRIT